MATEYIKLVLDVVILIGLAGFIFYALQLTRALNAFRAHRHEFDDVMKELNKHIDDAQKAVFELKETSGKSGNDLQKLVRDAQFLADELQLMNKTGNSVASRLEDLAERNSRPANPAAYDFGENVSPISKKRVQVKAKGDDGFMIHDPDFDDPEILTEGTDDDFDGFADDDPAMEKLSSAAEKELYRALQKNKK